MLTIFNPHTLLHYHIPTFINNSKQSSIVSNQAGGREKSTSLCVFSKNYFTFEPHSRLPHLSDQVALLYLLYPFGACRRRNLSAASVGL